MNKIQKQQLRQSVLNEVRMAKAGVIKDGELDGASDKDRYKSLMSYLPVLDDELRAAIQMDDSDKVSVLLLTRASVVDEICLIIRTSNNNTAVCELLDLDFNEDESEDIRMAKSKNNAFRELNRRFYNNERL